MAGRGALGVGISEPREIEERRKIALGWLELDDPFARLVERSGFDELPVTFAHTAEVQALPPHHHDPFDRMLVAQARLDGLALVTHDRQFERYHASLIWS